MRVFISIIIFLIIILLFFLLFSSKTSHNNIKVVKNITLTTEDNINIVGSFYPIEDRRYGIILLHMLRRDRNSWGEFPEKLNKEGYNVLSLDLRGHGESDLDWQNFTEKDFNAMILDVKAGYDFLKDQGAEKIFVIGASIGANTVINFGAKYPEVSGIISLSPSFDYRGIKTEENIKIYQGPIMIVSSEDDIQSFSDAKKLFDLSTSQNKKALWYRNAGHGTLMFNKEEPELANQIIEWVNNIRG